MLDTQGCAARAEAVKRRGRLGHAVSASLERVRALCGATGNVIYLMYTTRRSFFCYLFSGRGLRAARTSVCCVCIVRVTSPSRRGSAGLRAERALRPLDFTRGAQCIRVRCCCRASSADNFCYARLRSYHFGAAT